MTPEILASVSESIEKTLEQWRAADARVRELHAELARCPGGDAERWEALLAEKARLDEFAKSLGHAVGRWVDLGGTLELLDPSDAVDPAAPEEDAGASTGTTPPGPATAASEAVETPAETPHEDVAPAVVPPATPAPPQAEPASAETSPPPATHALEAPRVPASRASLQELARVGIGGHLRIEEAHQQQIALRHLKEGRHLLRAPLTPEAVPRVTTWVRDVHRLNPLHDGALHSIARAATARLRSLQERHPDVNVDALFDRLVAWVDKRRPGFVHGLALKHKPQSTSWDEDADRALKEFEPGPQGDDDRARLALDALAAEVEVLTPEALQKAVLSTLDAGVAADDRRLLQLLRPRYDDLKGNKRLARIRKALRTEERKQSASPNAPKDAPPPDWPFWHLTRGKTAVIVGGALKPDARDRIRQAFGFARVEWPENDPKQLARLAERAANGSVDVVLFTRWGGHDMDNVVLAPIRNDLSRWVRLDRSYGVLAVRQAMEQHWAALAAPPDGSG